MKNLKIENLIEDKWVVLPEKLLSEREVINTQRLILFAMDKDEPVKLDKNWSFVCSENDSSTAIEYDCLSCILCYLKGNIDYPIVTFTVMLGKKLTVTTNYFKVNMPQNIFTSVKKWLPDFEYKLAVGYKSLKAKPKKIN